MDLRLEALLERLDHHHDDLVAVVLEVALGYSPVLDLFLDSFVVLLEVCYSCLYVNTGEVIEADLLVGRLFLDAINDKSVLNLIERGTIFKTILSF